jgi:hypothetical protein
MSKRMTPRLVKLLVPSILCALVAAGVAGAQTSRGHARATKPQATRPRTTSRNATPASSTEQTPASSSPSVPEDDADLAITANVTAKELKFETVPNPNVEFPGRPRRETEWSAERTNLPPQVQPGVTYRDIGIRLKIVSRFADIDRIVAEALGERPMSDDAAPQATPPPPANEAQPATELATQPTAATRDNVRQSATRVNVGRQAAASRKARARAAGRFR